MAGWDIAVDEVGKTTIQWQFRPKLSDVIGDHDSRLKQVRDAKGDRNYRDLEGMGRLVCSMTIAPTTLTPLTPSDRLPRHPSHSLLPGKMINYLRAVR